MEVLEQKYLTGWEVDPMKKVINTKNPMMGGGCMIFLFLFKDPARV